MIIRHEGTANRIDIHPTPQCNIWVDITSRLISRNDPATKAWAPSADMLMEFCRS